MHYIQLFEKYRTSIIAVTSWSRGKGTIQNALKVGDVKYDLYLHKLLLEAIVRSKMHHAMKTDEKFSYQLDKTQILMQNVIKNITKQNSDESEQSFDQFVEFHQLF